MFKEFFKERKGQCEIIGILNAIGALFLAIPTPEEEAVKYALSNIKFIWLLIIAISDFILFGYFAMLSFEWERNIRNRTGISFKNTLSSVAAGIVGYWLYWLGKYTYLAYEYNLKLALAWFCLFSMFVLSPSCYRSLRFLFKKKNILYPIIPFVLSSIAGGLMLFFGLELLGSALFTTDTPFSYITLINYFFLTNIYIYFYFRFNKDIEYTFKKSGKIEVVEIY